MVLDKPSPGWVSERSLIVRACVHVCVRVCVCKREKRKMHKKYHRLDVQYISFMLSSLIFKTHTLWYMQSKSSRNPTAFMCVIQLKYTLTYKVS